MMRLFPSFAMPLETMTFNPGQNYSLRVIRQSQKNNSCPKLCSKKWSNVQKLTWKIPMQKKEAGRFHCTDQAFTIKLRRISNPSQGDFNIKSINDPYILEAWRQVQSLYFSQLNHPKAASSPRKAISQGNITWRGVNSFETQYDFGFQNQSGRNSYCCRINFCRSFLIRSRRLAASSKSSFLADSFIFNSSWSISSGRASRAKP